MASKNHPGISSGRTVKARDLQYIQRPADAELLDHCRNGRPAYIRNTQRHKAVTTIAGLVLCWCVMAPEICTALDAYVVYGGKNYQEKESFLAALSKDFSVKTYNVDRLNEGDYSEKQKALTKFENASAIVFLFDEPMKLFGGSPLSPDLIIVQSIMTSVKSEARTLYVLSQDMDSAQLEEQLKILHRTADVVRVKEKTLSVIAAASLVTAKLLKSQ